MNTETENYQEFYFPGINRARTLAENRLRDLGVPEHLVKLASIREPGGCSDVGTDFRSLWARCLPRTCDMADVTAAMVPNHRRFICHECGERYEEDPDAQYGDCSVCSFAGSVGLDTPEWADRWENPER